MSKIMIPVCEPTLRGNELNYATQAITTGWISSAGSFIQQFEEKFSAYCGTKFGISCSNGTTALHLAIEALGIGKGDEVIIPSFTMIASCNAVIYTGAKAVLVDSELKTWNLDAHKIEEKITPRTKAIMVVHTYGHPADMDTVNAIAKKHSLYVIEDAAEAYGAEYKGRKAGSLGDIAAFSFYANKIITTGEGGMVVTNNKQWADRAKALRNHYFGEPRFLHHDLGYNHRLTNIQAAIGVAQLERIEELIAARKKNAQLYNTLLRDVLGLVLPPEESWAKNVYWMYGLLVTPEFGMSMPELRAKLLERGVDTRTFFIGMHRQPVYQDGKDERYPKTSDPFPNAEILERQGFYLPSSSHLTEEQIRTVAQIIKEIQLEHGHKSKT